MCKNPDCEVQYMRLFIAIGLSDEIRKTLVKTQDYLLRHGVRGRYTAAENLHMTLAFIGEMPDPDPVLDVLEGFSFAPFDIALQDAGIFIGGILWAGIRPSDPLERMVKRLRRALAEAEIPFDRQGFRPHITLVRDMRTEKGLPEIHIPGSAMTVDHITLFRSDRGKNGMIYTEIG